MCGNILAFDPDTKSTGIAEFGVAMKRISWIGTAAVSAALPLQARIVEMAKTLEEVICDASDDIAHVAIEFQHARPGDPRPNDILHLQTVTGILIGLCCRRWPLAKLWLPIPVEWKGSIKKDIHQAHILKRHPEILNLDHGLNKTQLGHALDAAGLASWVNSKLVQKILTVVEARTSSKPRRRPRTWSRN